MSIGVASSQQTFPESTYSLRNPLIFSLRAPGTTIGETLESGGGVDEKGIIHWMKSRHPLDDPPMRTPIGLFFIVSQQPHMQMVQRELNGRGTGKHEKCS
jgi:hypothetical protein